MTRRSGIFDYFRVGMCVVIFLAGLAFPLHTVLAQDKRPAVQEPDSGVQVILDKMAAPVVLNKDLRDLPREEIPGPVETQRLDVLPVGEPRESFPPGPDPLLQDGGGTIDMPSPTTFSGMDFATWGAGWPPDTVGDVGPNHYIQAVNTSFAIYSKAGTQLVASTFNTLFNATGTPCDTNNNGDVIALYDHLADRWILSDFAWTDQINGPYYECIAVSQSGDPVAGGWYLYANIVDTTIPYYLHDYPKWGVWPDAYYMTANMFDFTITGSTYIGPHIQVYDRADMLAGTAVDIVFADLPSLYFTVLPSNLEGPPPPAGAPNYFVSVTPYTLNNELLLWEFHVDWATPANSSFSGPTFLGITAFDSTISCGATGRDCIPQQGTTQMLDVISWRLMAQLQYRNLGTYESLWLNHTVDVDTANDIAGIRWYEIRDPGGTPTLYQQASFGSSGAGAVERWMGSLAVDREGNMAMGYSASSSTLYPSIYYVGRLVTDPLNSLPQVEGVFFAGTGYQDDGGAPNNRGARWGDYSAMSVDPTDDCTFWYTTEYYDTQDFIGNWKTRIGSFKYPSCGAIKYWAGGTSTAWNDGSNWSPAGVPTRDDDVVIDVAHRITFWPTVNADGEAQDITIDTGAQLNASAAFSLRVYGKWLQNGTGVFNAAAGAVLFRGAGPTLSMGVPGPGNHFFHLQIGENSKTAVTLTGAVRVDGNLTVSANSRLAAGANAITLGGNFMINPLGAFTPGAGLSTFTGGSQGITTYQLPSAWTVVRAVDSFETWTPGATGAPSGWTEQDSSGAAGDWVRGDQTPNPAGGATPPTGGGSFTAKFNSATAAFGSSTRIFTTSPFSTAGYTQCRIQFWMYHDTASAYLERMTIEGSTNGTTFTDVGKATARYDGSGGAAGAWKEHWADFSAFAGLPTVYLSFEGLSWGAGGSDMFIDLASVECRAATSDGLTTFNNLTVNNGSTTAPTGNLAVNTNLTVNGNAHLDLSTHDLTVDGALTNNGRISQTKNAPAATTQFLRITNAAAAITKYYGVDITPAVSMGTTTVSIYGNQATCTNNPADSLITRCYNITPTTPQNATIRFWYTEAERHSQLAGALLVWHSTSTPPYVWTQVGNGYTYSDGTTICASGGGLACWMQANNIASYSPFGLGSGGTPTAIRLRSLKASSGWSALPLIALAAAAAAGGLLILRRKRG